MNIENYYKDQVVKIDYLIIQIEKNIKINTKKLRDLKTKYFNDYLKKNKLKPRPGVIRYY